MTTLAKELRIGNLIEYCNDADGDKIHSVKVIEKKSINSCSPKLYKPIPLTKEWLLKFSFDKAINDYWNEAETFGVNLHSDCIEIIYDAERINIWHIKYVHQLQNLYFALTGEELTVK